MARLTGTRALVTGATTGLGRAMAQALADAGATGRGDQPRPRTRAERRRGELGADASGLELDVRDEARWRQRSTSVYERLGGLDLLVNNAGIGMRTVNPRFLTEPQPF